MCATRDGGAAADPKGRVGTLEPGKFADMVLVNGDPIADIRVMQDHSKLSAIIKGGVIYRDLVNDVPAWSSASDLAKHLEQPASKLCTPASVLEPAE